MQIKAGKLAVNTKKILTFVGELATFSKNRNSEKTVLWKTAASQAANHHLQ